MIPALLFGAIALLQVVVTVWLWWSHTYTRSEKSAQTKLIWLLPGLGAAFVLVMLLENARQS